MEVELLVDAKAITGEGPVWDERDDGLYWVDIMLVHIVAVHHGQLRTFYCTRREAGTVA